MFQGDTPKANNFNIINFWFHILQACKHTYTPIQPSERTNETTQISQLQTDPTQSDRCTNPYHYPGPDLSQPF